MSEFSQNRGQGLLMVARITIESFAAFFLTASALHYGVTCSRIGALFEQLQLITAAAALSLPILAFWLSITMIFGRIYCSTICPLGALIDFFGRLRPKSHVFRYKRPLNIVRSLSVALCITLLIIGWGITEQWLEPWGLFHSIVSSVTSGAVTIASIASTAIVAVLAISAVSRGRIFCNTLCPVGGILGYFARRSAFHIDINTDRCIQCRKCADVCKAECIDLNDHVADMSRCVVCFNCLPVCPNEAISYTINRHSLSTPLMQKINSLKTDNPSTSSLVCDNTSTSSTTSLKTEHSKPTAQAQEL